MNLEQSKLFTPCTDPESGVTVYVLTEKVAPVQEAFYFVNDSMDADGRYLWFYCAFPPSGSAAQGRTLGVEEVAWGGGTWHAHNSRTGAYLVGDARDYTTQFYRGGASTVDFLNRETGRKLRLANNPEMPGIVGSSYHIDPHPRFCASDRFVVFTTTVRGEVDIALVSTSDLVDRTS